jgi:hypothetical protein
MKMKNLKNPIALAIVVIFICIIMYVIYNKKYEFFDSKLTPTPVSTDIPQQTTNPTTIPTNIPQQTTNPTMEPKKTPEIPIGFSQDSLGFNDYESIDSINSNLYDVQHTINPTMTSTMTTLPPVIFNDIKPSPNPDKTIQSALLPAQTPFPTLSTITNIPTNVPTNNFSMPFDTSLHTSEYNGMDKNQGYLFGVTQKNFGLHVSGDL